jgi:hypothetical protein
MARERVLARVSSMATTDTAGSSGGWLPSGPRSDNEERDAERPSGGCTPEQGNQRRPAWRAGISILPNRSRSSAFATIAWLAH